MAINGFPLDVQLEWFDKEHREFALTAWTTETDWAAGTGYLQLYRDSSDPGWYTEFTLVGEQRTEDLVAGSLTIHSRYYDCGCEVTANNTTLPVTLTRATGTLDDL